MWSQAIEAINRLPFPISPAKSLYAFLNPDLSLQTHQTTQNSESGDPKKIAERLMRKISSKKSHKKPRLVRSGQPCSCTDCGQPFTSPYFLNMHLRNSGQKEACLHCGVMVPRGNQIVEHLAVVHNENVCLCQSCPLWFHSETELKKHVKTAHKAAALTCSDCGRSFPRRGAFEAHAQMHTVRTCRNCQAQFTNRTCYRKHRSICEPDAKPDTQNMTRNRRANVRDPATFICDYCKKTYHSRPQLKNHIMWIHMDIRPHQCQWCGKRFYTPARLAEHSVVHTRVRNFGCDICGLKLVSKMAAVYHRRRHTGEKPYECEDCGEKFISASRRSEHAKRRHGKGTRFQCKLCTASFVRSHELRRHDERGHKPVVLIGS